MLCAIKRCCLAFGLVAALSLALSARAADQKPKDDPTPVVIDPAKPSPEILKERPRGGLIFANANMKTGNGVVAVNRQSLIAIDPETGKWATVLDAGTLWQGVSPDGRTVAYELENALWTRSVAGGDEPKKILDLAGPGNGSAPIWSGDGKRIILSLGNQDPLAGRMVYLNIQLNADGTGVTELPLAKSVLISDWSADGKNIAGMSWEQPKWELVVVHADGSDLRIISDAHTKQPRMPRFSPDGRRIVHVDGTDIWVSDNDGTHRRKLWSADARLVGSACWSPDAARLAYVGRRQNPQGGLQQNVIEIIALDDLHRVARIELPGTVATGYVHWR